MLYPPALLQRLKEAYPLSDIIGKYVPLQRRGKDIKACCPFHKEKTPSFTIKDEREYYHCFGCGAHGDHFTFLQRIEGLSFTEAVERVAGLAGISLPKPEPLNPERKERLEQQKDDYALLQAASDFFIQQLAAPAAAPVRDYVSRRGLTSETVTSFGLGYAPDSRHALKDHLLKQGFKEAAMVEQGLLIRPEGGGATYDRFRGRLMFPIQDKKGRVIAFGGRILGEGQPKYLNSPETPLFHKSEVLYNWHRARQAAHQRQRLILVEGYMDVIALAQAGIAEAVAPLGTALGEAHLQQGWSIVREPILCLDGDTAGLRAMERACEVALPLLKPGLGIGFALLGNGDDPDTLIRSGGRPAMEAVLADPKPLSQMVWESYRQKFVPGESATPEQKAALENALEKLSGQLADSKVQAYFRDYFRQQCRFGLRSKVASKTGGKGYTASGARPVRASALSDPKGGLWEGLMLAVVLRHPWLLEQGDIERALSEAPFARAGHAELRAALMAALSALPDLTPDSLQAYLSQQGQAAMVKALLADARLRYEPALRPDADAVAVSELWQRVLAELEQHGQRQAGAEQQAALMGEMTEASWEQYVAWLNAQAKEQEQQEG